MRRDRVHVEDMRLACDRIREFISGMDRESFIADARTLSAVERQITILGEAANRVSATTRANHPEVPWRRVINLRNFYVHGYERISPAEVWATAVRLAPHIRGLLDSIVTAEDSATEQDSMPKPPTGSD